MNNLAPLQHVVELDAYNWLSQQEPHYIDAIEECIRNGATPDSIRRFISSKVGPNRQGIVTRVTLAAEYILSQQHA
jgi:hypothetical protein